MKFGHERLDVYQLSVKYVGWAYSLSRQLKGIDRHARDQLLRASQSIPLNIAEGNGKGTQGDRRRFFEIARGSAAECAAIQDVLVECDILSVERCEEGKTMLHRIVSMLPKLAPRDYTISEDAAVYNDNDNDCDHDNDYGND